MDNRLTPIAEKAITYGVYRGIPFHIAHPHSGFGWAAYIFLALDRFEDEDLRDALWVDAEYSSSRCTAKTYPVNRMPLIAQLPAYKGVTWYSKELAGDDGRCIKVGWDYSHHGDKVEYFSVQWLLEDIKQVINYIHKHQTYLLTCSATGELLRESEGEYQDGRFVSFASQNTELKEVR